VRGLSEGFRGRLSIRGDFFPAPGPPVPAPTGVAGCVAAGPGLRRGGPGACRFVLLKGLQLLEALPPPTPNASSCCWSLLNRLLPLHAPVRRPVFPGRDLWTLSPAGASVRRVGIGTCAQRPAGRCGLAGPGRCWPPLLFRFEQLRSGFGHLAEAAAGELQRPLRR